MYNAGNLCTVIYYYKMAQRKNNKGNVQMISIQLSQFGTNELKSYWRMLEEFLSFRFLLEISYFNLYKNKTCI